MKQNFISFYDIHIIQIPTCTNKGVNSYKLKISKNREFLLYVNRIIRRSKVKNYR